MARGNKSKHTPKLPKQSKVSKQSKRLSAGEVQRDRATVGSNFQARKWASAHHCPECHGASTHLCVKKGHLGYCPVCKQILWRKTGCRSHGYKGDDMWDEPNPKAEIKHNEVRPDETKEVNIVQEAIAQTATQ